MNPPADQPLPAMPLTTKDEAITFVSAYREWLNQTSSIGNGAFIGTRSKPATARAPDLTAKARVAYEMAELNYWQMPYEQARKRYEGLPLAKWQAERAKRGMGVEAA